MVAERGSWLFKLFRRRVCARRATSQSDEIVRRWARLVRRAQRLRRLRRIWHHLGTWLADQVGQHLQQQANAGLVLAIAQQGEMMLKQGNQAEQELRALREGMAATAPERQESTMSDKSERETS